MPFCPHLKLTQLLLITFEQVFKKNSDSLFVNEPIEKQMNISPLEMVKFSLQLDRNLNAALSPGGISKSMSISEMANWIETELKTCDVSIDLPLKRTA